MGSKKRPFYRVVVADSRSPRGGRFIEEIGTYNPLTEPASVKIDAERVKYWIGTGAKPTDTVNRILKENKVLESASDSEALPVEEEKVEEVTVEEESEEEVTEDVVSE